jgi:hypothetical protein
MKSSCVPQTNGSTLSGMGLTNAESLADSSRPPRVGSPALRGDRGLEAIVLAAVVAESRVSGCHCRFNSAAFAPGQAKRAHALGSGRAAVVRGELPGEVDARAGVCNVPGVPRGRRAGDDCVLDFNEVTT